jgi:hypothetical protein
VSFVGDILPLSIIYPIRNRLRKVSEIPALFRWHDHGSPAAAQGLCQPAIKTSHLLQLFEAADFFLMGKVDKF